MYFVPRKLYFNLKKHLNRPEISLILGPRQAGKTTLIERLREELKTIGEATVFLNLDIIEDRQWFVSQHTLLDLIQKKVGNKRAYIFIDEISRLENAGLFLKGLYDLKSKHKFIVTGSGSLELRDNIIEPLTGRKQIFYCTSLSFSEFVIHKLGIESDDFEYLRTEALKDLITEPMKRQRFIKEYINFGGYPNVVLAETEEEKIQILKEIYTSYLEKDIGLLLGVEKTYAFENLIKVLSSQVGNLINRSELAGTLGVAEKTIERYLYLLEKTFVVDLVRPFYSNARKELVKSPKIYFADLGFLYIAQGILPSIQRKTEGNVFENACFLRLKELDLIKSPHFWRTKSGAEVDFIIESSDTGKPVPVEIKSTNKQTLGKSLISFIKAYRPESGFIYYLDGSKQENSRLYDKTKVNFIPYYYLPEEVISLGS